jgi:hypothetical protein
MAERFLGPLFYLPLAATSVKIGLYLASLITASASAEAAVTRFEYTHCT